MASKLSLSILRLAVSDQPFLLCQNIQKYAEVNILIYANLLHNMLLLSGFGLDKHSLTGEYDCFCVFSGAKCGVRNRDSYF